MKINATFTKKSLINLDKEKKKRINRLDASLLIISSVIALGILVGITVFILSESAFQSDLYSSFLRFSTDVKNKSFIETASGFIFGNILFALCMIFSGTSFLGEFTIYPVLFFKSAGLGSIAAYLIKKFHTSGMGYYFLAILPGKIIMIFAVLMLTQSSVQMSRKIKNSLNNCVKDADLRLFYIRAVVSIFLLFIAALTDTVAVRMFSSFFNLPF